MSMLSTLRSELEPSVSIRFDFVQTDSADDSIRLNETDSQYSLDGSGLNRFVAESRIFWCRFPIRASIKEALLGGVLTYLQ